MRQLLLSIVFLHGVFFSFGQCPTENITLTSQGDVNDFALNYTGCTQLLIDITISGEDIVDLSPLAQITATSQTIFVLDNPNLVSMSGLSTIQLEGPQAGVSIANNPLLEVINFYTQTAGQIESISIRDCPNIQDLTAFVGISNLLDLTLYRNDQLATLSGMENIETLFNINIGQNNSLLSLLPLGNMTNDLMDEINLFSNPLLENLNGLEGVTGIDALGMSIGSNAGLRTLEGLQNLVNIPGMEIINNDQLLNLDALNITSEIQYVDISGNELLANINGLATMPISMLDFLRISNNPLLSMCNIEAVCSYLDGVGMADIENNAPNCNSVEEVIESCNLTMNENKQTEISIYPNPVSEILTVTSSEILEIENLKVYSITGNLVLESTRKSIDVSNLAAGVYFLEVFTNESSIVKKIVKQ